LTGGEKHACSTILPLLASVVGIKVIIVIIIISNNSGVTDMLTARGHGRSLLTDNGSICRQMMTGDDDNGCCCCNGCDICYDDGGGVFVSNAISVA